MKQVKFLLKPVGGHCVYLGTVNVQNFAFRIRVIGEIRGKQFP